MLSWLLLLLAAAVVLAAACWKRLLGLGVSRFAKGQRFQLTVGSFFFAGAADVHLRLHAGPVREVRVARLALGMSIKGRGGSGSGSSDGGGGGSGGSMWQALLSGQLLLPVSVQGVQVRLAPAPPAAPAPPPAAPDAAAPVPAAAPAPGPRVSGSGSGKKARAARAPLQLLGHLPLRVDGMEVVDEERGVHLRLQRISLSLHSAQQLVLEGLTAGLTLGGSGPDAVTGSSGGSGSAPASPRKLPGLPGSPFKRQAPLPALEVDPVLQLDRLLLEHQHDGSGSLKRLLLQRAASAGASSDGGPAAAAAAAAGEPAGLVLQRLSLQLGTASLTVSRRLLVWAQAQQAAATEAALQRPPRLKASSGDGVSQAKPQQLQRLLALLPKEAELAVESCSIATDAPAPNGSAAGSSALGSPREAASLPVTAAFSLSGISCRLAKAAAATGGTSTGATLASIAAGWQRLAVSLGAAPAASAASQQQQQQQQLPSALAMSSGAAEWSLALSRAAGGSSSSPAALPVQLEAAAEVSIGALHTDVCHLAVQPLVEQLRLAAKAAKAARQPAGGKAAAEQAAQAAAAPQPKARGPPLLVAWQGSLSLGDGSRMLFTDAVGRCCWSSGLASCRLALRSGSGGSSDAGQAASGLSGSFEAQGIEMHAVTTAGASLAGEHSALPDGPPPQMLAARLLRLQVEHGQPEAEQSQLAATAVDATTAGVHLLVQQQQLAAVASVVLSLLPPPKAASLPGTPPRPTVDDGSNAGALLAVAAAAAAAAVAPHDGQRPRPRRAPPRISVSCADTLLLLPTQVPVPANQALNGQLLLLPAAAALALSSVRGSLGGGGSGDMLQAEGCCLLYCEGPGSQRFPSSSDALKEQATAALLSVDSATFHAAPAAGDAAAQPDVSTDGGEGAMQLQLGAVAATADADGLLCLAAVADSAAQQLASAMAAAAGGSGAAPLPKSRRPKAPKQPRALALTVGRLRVEQPLCADRDIAVDVSSLHAVVGTQRGSRHSVRTADAVLSMRGKPIIRYRQLEAALQLSDSSSTDGVRLPVQPLPHPWPAAAPEGGGADGMPAAAASGGEAGSSREAYERARLEAWLDADAATSPAAGAGAGAAAAALGAGPASILDAHVSGAELIVPHDGEPGPTERYCELYAKALDTALQQHLQRLRQFKQQRRTSSGGGGGAADSVAAAAQLPEPAPAPRKASARLFPMQVNLTADDAALRFEHHPLEAWLASRGPLLRHMAVQQHLWGEVAATVQPADSASPLHAAMVESAFATVQVASQQAWEGLLQDLLQLYRGRLRQLDARTATPAGGAASAGSSDGAVGGGAGSRGSSSDGSGGGSPAGGPDLLLLSASRVQALLVVCVGSPEARAAAEAQIAAVDPPSRGVPMAKALKLHADVAAADFEMRLAGASRPFVSARAARLSGAAAVARQATAPPRTTARRLPLGAHRTVEIPVTVKGCRPSFKFFTDLRLDAAELAVCHSQGLEPALALVSLAGKRLSPSDPDKTAPRPPPIPWWDDMRYMWRGPVAAAIQRFQLTLAASDLPDVDDTSERMEVEVLDVAASLLSGAYELSAGPVCATVHRSAGVQQLGGTLLELPFLEAPGARLRLGVDWKMPGGRPASEHHLFPLEVPREPGALQEPVYAGLAYRAQSWDLDLQVELGPPGGTPGEAPGSGASTVAYLGGHQIQWMKQFVGVLNRMPPQLRQVARRGSFFWRKPPPPPGAPPKKGMGKMTQRLSLNISAAPLEIVHFAADPSDGSHGVRLHAPACSYTACYLLNQPVPSFLRLPPHARGRCPPRARTEPTRTLTLDMAVRASAVTVHKAALGQEEGVDELFDGGGSGLTGTTASAPGTATAGGASARAAWAPPQAQQQQRLARQGSSGTGLGVHLPDEESSNLLDDLMGPAAPRAQRPPIIAAGVVTVTQDSQAAAAGGAGADDPAADPLADALRPHGSRPLRVLISDCRVLVDGGARDAVWGAVAHLVSAFSSSGAQQRRHLSNAAGHESVSRTPSVLAGSPSPTTALTTSPSMPWSAASPAAQLQRQLSQQRSLQASPAPSADFAGAAAAAMGSASPERHVGAWSAPPPPQQQVPPSGESGSDLLALLLQQQAQRGSNDGGGDGDGGGGEGGAEGEPQSPELMHPGPGLGGVAEEEDEGAPLSSAADDAHGQLRYVVEVADLQITAEADAAQGRLLLAARSGRLRGLHLPDAGLLVTALELEQVSAYVTQLDVDPDAPVLWLQPTADGYQLPPGLGTLPFRRVFDPIQISLRHSKLSTGGGGGARRRSQPSSRGGHRRSPSLGTGGALARGEELLLRVPDIKAMLDSREFEVLVDVISVAQAPGPQVDGVGAEAQLLAELDGEEVGEARCLYALLRQQLADLRQTSLQLRSGLGLQPFGSQLAAPPARGGLLVPPLGVTHFLVADTADFVAVQFSTQAELTVAMREHLAAASAAAVGKLASGTGEPGSGVISPTSPDRLAAAQRRVDELAAAAAVAAARRRLGNRAVEQAQALLLRWAEEQEGAAYEALEAAKSSLLALKAVARKRQQKTAASRVLLQVDRLVWQLCTPQREPFIQATIRRLSLDKFRNRDHSGFAKFGIRRIEILDALGVLGPGPGIGAGVILSVWNPDASWERDDMLRVVASQGVPTQTHVVYDHLDIIAHPIAFHLTEGLAVAFWEYFFPREDEAKARAAAAFARSVAVPAAAAARHRRSATALPAALTGAGADPGASHQGSPVAGSPAKRHGMAALLAAGDGGSQPGSGGQSPLVASTPKGAAVTNAGWRSAPSKLHRQSTSGSGEAGGGVTRQTTLDRQAAAEAAALAAAAVAAGGGEGGGGPPMLQRLSGSYAHLQRTSGNPAAGGTAGGRLYRPLSSVSMASEDSSVAARAAATPLPKVHRKVRFVHVKINRAHCRATYEGYPLTFTDLKLVIDNRTYSNIEGRWRDLFARMKWDMVKSVVKSVAGLQGRKFKELLPEGFPGEEGEGGGRRKPGLLAQLQALGKGRKEALGAAGGEGAATGEELRAEHKRRMLFGQAHLSRTSQSAAAAAPATSLRAPTAAAAPGAGGAGGSPRSSLPSSPAASVERSGGPSGGATPRSRDGSAELTAEVAGRGQVFPSLQGATAALGASREASDAQEGDEAGDGDAAAAALLGQQPGVSAAGNAGGSGSARGSLPTPRWAKQLASGAKKGLTKLRDSLQDSQPQLGGSHLQ